MLAKSCGLGRIFIVCFFFVAVVIYTSLKIQSYRGELPNPIHSQSRHRENFNWTKFRNPFPKIIHQMWKDIDNTIPADLKRWKSGCKQVNIDYEFRLYDDSELLTFVESTYPLYVPLYKSLKGVFMADMARVLIIYHYGGIYMDLDFYCHRPFHCLVESLVKFHNTSKFGPNLLVVPQETMIHANTLRNKTRVVIQDFFLATPKHPFFKWFLDDRLAKYERNIAEGLPLDKKPFSFVIEEDIDRYRSTSQPNVYRRSRRRVSVRDHRNHSKYDEKLRNRSGPGSVNVQQPGSVKSQQPESLVEQPVDIIELGEDVLHALADWTNPSLEVACRRAEKANNVPVYMAKSCAKLRKGDIFHPTERTIAVHMWSHVYVRWYPLRYLRMLQTAANVVQELPPTLTCPT